jgi:hypothetical protein
MIEIQPPNREFDYKKTKIFLAGSIEMNNAEPWQKELMDKFSDNDVIFLNPRRDDWNLGRSFMSSNKV